MLRPADREKTINSRDKTILVNPASLSEYHARVLNLLLLQQRSNKVKVIEKNREYVVECPEKMGGSSSVKVMITNTLVYRAKKIPGNPRKHPRYSVVSDILLGAGDYGGVYAVSGTLVQKQGGRLIYKTHKQRAIKIQEHNFKKPLEIAKNEAELSCCVPYMHAKKLTLQNDETGKPFKSFMVEKLFHGDTLDKILFSDKTDAPLTLGVRMQISINLLRALQQLHENGIIHRDLKTQNVMVDRQTCEVIIIDLGLSRKTDRDDNRYSGNMAYKAPEAITKRYPYDQNSDLYSIGLILAEIWRATPRDSAPWHTVEYVRSELIADREVANLNTLFAGIPGISQDQKIFLETAIKSMIEIKPQLRCSLRSAINVFEEAKLQRSLCGEFLKDQQIRAAHEAAMDANAKLKELAKLPSEKSLQEAGGIIFTALEKVADTKSAVTMFAAILEFKLLSGLETRAEIKKAITGAIAAFSDNYQQLQDLRNSQSGSQILQGNEQTEFLDDIDECIHKCNKHRATLHDINEFNARISKQIDRLKSLMPDARIKILTVQEEIRKEETIVIPEAKSTPDKINIKLSTFESSFFNRSRLCSRSIDIIENYRNEPIQARRRSP